METFSDKVKRLFQEHEELITRKNEPVEGGNGIFTRYKYPVVTAAHAPVFWRYDLNEDSNPYLMERIGSTSTYPMSQMQPTFRRFYRMRTFSILHLFNGMIIAVIYNLFLFHFCMGHIVHQSPTNTATASGINKSILRTGIKGIFSHVTNIR